MSKKLTAKLNRNIHLYGYVKIFVKQVYLALTLIYLTVVGHITLPQIGLIATLGAVITLVSNVPAGYFADRFQKRTSLIIGAVLCAGSALVLVFGATFWFGLAEVLLMALGWSFLGGAAEALMYDSLIYLKREHDYAKVMGRAQTTGLIGNVILVSLVPLTYNFNPRLPFLLGFVSYLFLVAACCLFTEPPRSDEDGTAADPVIDTAAEKESMFKMIRGFTSRDASFMFIISAAIAVLYTSGNYSLVFKDLGVNPALIGFIFAIPGVLGAIGGYFIQDGLKLSLRGFIWLDAVMCTSVYIVVGLTANLWLFIIIWSISTGFWRLRRIVYQQHILERLGTPQNRATLLSVFDFVDGVQNIWVPLFVATMMSAYGYYSGYFIVGCVFLTGTVVAMFLWKRLGKWS